MAAHARRVTLPHRPNSITTCPFADRVGVTARANRAYLYIERATRRAGPCGGRKEDAMYVTPETIIILVLLGFIVGMIVGVALSRPIYPR